MFAVRLSDILIEFGDKTALHVFCPPWSGSVALAAFGQYSTVRSRLTVEALRGLTSLFLSLRGFGAGAPRVWV